MKKSRLWILIIGLVLVVGAVTGGIVAWLTDTDATGNKVFTVGDVEYEWAGTFLADDSIIVPGQNIIATDVSLTNTSNVASEIRVRITIETTFTLPQGAYARDYVTILLATGWTELTQVGTTNVYLATYQAGAAVNGKFPVSVGTDVPLFAAGYTNDVSNGIALDGWKVGNEFTGATFTFNFVFEAKQNDYVTWAQMDGEASFSFSTGLLAA